MTSLAGREHTPQDRRLNVAVLEPYYGGSHASFVDTIRAHSRHHITLATMPPRKWKWRMRGAAIWFARDGAEWFNKDNDRRIDVILCNDMLSVADLKALLPARLRDVPVICYFHENQLTYPIPDDQSRDYQYGMTNITSCLAADAVWFNSEFHLTEFLQAARALLGKMPDYVPSDVIGEIRTKARVVPPPVSAGGKHRPSRAGAVPTILWCHRWEYDKHPEPFFEAMIRLAQSGRAFRLVLLGEQFRTAPPVFAESWDRLKPHIDHTGYIPDRDAYLALLGRCDLVVSTAIQENFGIAVVEAILAGCQPLLPNRLAYPELIPPDLHEYCLYPGDRDLYDRLAGFIDGTVRFSKDQRNRLQSFTVKEFGLENTILRIDEGLSEVKSAVRS